MGASDATELLRPGVLEGVSVLVACAPGALDGALGPAVRDACAELGAQVSTCRPDAAGEAALDAAVAEIGRLDLVVVDGAGLFAHGGLRPCMDSAWNATRAVAGGAFLPAAAGGRIVYLAPAPDAGDHAEAACAGLENLARTLSIEWARHGITTVTIAPGVQTPAGEVAALTAYLASPAGAYFSGCLLDLRGP